MTDIIHIIDWGKGGAMHVAEALMNYGMKAGHNDAFMWFDRDRDGNLLLANRDLHWVAGLSPVAAKAASIALACSLDVKHDFYLTFDRISHSLPRVTRVIVASMFELDFPVKPLFTIDIK